MVLDSDLRMSLCRSLIMLRNKELLTSISILELFFKLFRCPDKKLREMLFQHIINDIKRTDALGYVAATLACCAVLPPSIACKGLDLGSQADGYVPSAPTMSNCTQT